MEYAEILAGSYHVHSLYCDGDVPIEAMVRAAAEAGLTEVGISSHAPLPFATEWTMAAVRLTEYVTEVRDLAERYEHRIRVLLGMELDYIPDPLVEEFQLEEVFPAGADYFVGSVHFLGGGDPPDSFDGDEATFQMILREYYGNDIVAMVTEYYRRVRAMLSMPGFQPRPAFQSIVGHLDVIKRWNVDRRYFRGDESWYMDAVGETLDAVAASGQLLELNTAGWRKGLGEPYPAPNILERCRDRDIPIIISSDAHLPEDVIADFERAEDLLAELEIPPRRFLDR